MAEGKQLNNLQKTEKKHKGNPNLKAGPGRPKGSQNKLTKTVKQAVLDAFEELGGADWLVSVGRKDPKTFSQLLAKCIPAEVTGKDGKDLIPEQKSVLVVPAQISPEAWTKEVEEITKK